MRSEQIDMIRDWLSPAKTSDANFRIECTVVRDLLDSEIDYVSALRLVVQVRSSRSFIFDFELPRCIKTSSVNRKFNRVNAY